MITTIDFETHPIDGNTSWKPPVPVGVAIKKGKRKGKYLSWGHPTNNNTTYEKAREELAKVWDSEILFHNSKFDVAVAAGHMNLPLPSDPLLVHDTMFSLFLDNPYSDTLSLKPNAERLLHIPPEERDRLTAWIMANTECRTEKQAGAWIWAAPGDLVGGS